jgi:hypothetical protein
MKADKLQVSNSAIRAAQTEVTRASKNLVDTYLGVITVCDHNTQGEAPYQEDRYGSHHSPPLRVCMKCGLVEEGWGCGYLVLTNELVYNLTRDQVFQLRSVQIENEAKGPLVRKEITVTELVTRKLGIE